MIDSTTLVVVAMPPVFLLDWTPNGPKPNDGCTMRPKSAACSDLDRPPGSHDRTIRSWRSGGQ